MIVNPRIPLHRVILSLSEALDHVHPQVVDHQQRVAYIAVQVARAMGFHGVDLLDVFNAAVLHDIGLISLENRVRALDCDQLEKVSWHPEAGYELLKGNRLFSRAAEFVRYHHTEWADGGEEGPDGRPIPLAGRILMLADVVERAIDRSMPVLAQAPSILKQTAAMAGKQLHPGCVEAFCGVARTEAFWLDTTGSRIYSVLLRQMDWPTLTVGEVALGSIAEIFGRMVDAISRFTAVHSAAVAATAAALAERLNFSPRELHLMRAAGFLHDLGKLSVPGRILDKSEQLDRGEMALIRGHTYHTFRILDTVGGLPQLAEWAAFHHERLDGRGYPFHHAAKDLTLGSRIMAVADTFAALNEDRPYRKGVGRVRTVQILNRLAETAALDGDVVALLLRDYDAVDAAQREQRVQYARKQQHLSRAMGGRPAAAAASS